jgi:hypothetical protein
MLPGENELYAQLRPEELRCTDAPREKLSTDAQIRILHDSMIHLSKQMIKIPM